jgi:hypothetical protein
MSQVQSVTVRAAPFEVTGAASAGARWYIVRTGRTNRCLEQASTTNAQTVRILRKQSGQRRSIP